MYYSEQHHPSFDFVKDSNDSNESGDQNWYYLYLSILKLSESNNNFKNLPTKNITRRDYSYKLRARIQIFSKKM